MKQVTGVIPDPHPSRLARSAMGGAVAGALALMIALLVLTIGGNAGSDWGILIPCAAVGTFAVTTLGFRLLLGLGRRLRVWMGVVAGLVIGVCAHAAMWYLMLLFANLTGVRSSLGEAPVDLLTALWACWVYAAASLVLTGWGTLPLSAVAGGLFVYFNRK